MSSSFNFGSGLAIVRHRNAESRAFLAAALRLSDKKNAEITNLSIFGSGIAVVKQKSAKFRQSLLAALRLLDKKTLNCKHYWQRPCDCLTDTFR